MRRACWAIVYAGCLIFVIVVALPARTLADAPRRRVVLIQVDAARASFLDQFLADGTLPPDGGFATLARSFKATFSTVVTPTLTTPNLATMVTGVYPQKHGMITNIYPTLTGTVTSGIYGHQQPLGVEGIWSAALRAGKKVGLIRTVGVNDNTMTNTWTLNFHEQRAAAKLITPTPGDWSSDLSSWNLGAFADAHSPRVMTFTLQDDYTVAELLYLQRDRARSKHGRHLRRARHRRRSRSEQRLLRCTPAARRADVRPRLR